MKVSARGPSEGFCVAFRKLSAFDDFNARDLEVSWCGYKVSHPSWLKVSPRWLPD